MPRTSVKLSLNAIAVLCLAACGSPSQSLGLFEKHSDVGQVRSAGSVQWQPQKEAYRITGCGENIWGERDAFHFLWRETSGDALMEAEVQWEGQGVEPHRKAGWMVRQSLEEDAPYADAVVHGDGLIALQYRSVQGGPTDEVRSPVKAPARLRLERHGDLFSLSVSVSQGIYEPVASLSVRLQDPVHAGLFVSAHHPDVLETALFSKVEFRDQAVIPDADRIVESTLEVIDVEAGRRRIVYRSKRHFEAPNWSRDGRFLIFNMEGRLYRLSTQGGEAEQIDTGSADHCNNDHGLSPDGERLAISHSPEGASLIYILPARGGEPNLVTPKGPSYWHGWSPDGKTLAYCAERDGEFDVYTIPAEGGTEKRLTKAAGLDDGPDYSPDGRYIYFNSERTGIMQIWRMAADGAAQKQVTHDENYADWFPHPSPDGRWLVFISYGKDVEGHPPNKDVWLRLIELPSGEPRVLATLFGGQGTLNVPSWSPDSSSVAFVSYRLVGP